MSSRSANGPLVQTSDVTKVYYKKRTRTAVLSSISLEIMPGEVLAIVGPSGAGKSTLLNIIGTLDRPSSGAVLYEGRDVFSCSERELAAFRNARIGFVFQFHHLLPEFTALENTMMPALIAGWDADKAASRAHSLLARMGLEKRISHKQGELSGGEQQRVAVARSLIMEPQLLLADEPTGNLDSHSGTEVFNLLLALNRELNMTLVVVTHNEGFAERLPRCVTLIDGKLEQ